MQIYLIEKRSNKRLINLGAKITLERLNEELERGNSLLLRRIVGDIQSDFRLRKVPEIKRRDRKDKTIKAFYSANLEMGKKGFETFSPKEVSYEQNLRFASLERAINMIEANQRLKRTDWIIEKKNI